MELREIRVHNIRSFEDATLRLGPGTSLLWGDVGAGKTSLLHAIEMALFGFSEVDPAHLIRHRAGTAEVRLTLSDGAHEYVFTRRFHRRMRRGRDQFETDEKATGLATDGAMTRYPATELRQRAIDLLGFPDNPNPRAHSDLWRWAVYVPQERMRQILDSEDGEARLETVRKALGLERYRTAAENAKLVAQELRRDAEERVKRSDLLAHWEADLAEAQRGLNSATAAARQAQVAGEAERSRQTDLESELGRAQARARQSEADRRHLEEVEEHRRDLGTRRGARRRRVAEVRDRISADRAEIDRLEGAARTAESLARTVAEVERENEGLAASVQTARDRALQHELDETRLREATAHLHEREADRARVAETLGRLRPAHEALVRELADLRPPRPEERSPEAIEGDLARAVEACERAAGELERCRSALRDSETLAGRGVCPTCGQRVDPASLVTHRTEVQAALEAAATRYEAAARERTERARERSEREARALERVRWESIEARARTAREALEAATADAERGEGARTAARREVEAAATRATATAPEGEAWTALQDRWRQGGERLQRLRAELTTAERARQDVRIHQTALEALRDEAGRLEIDEGTDRARSAELEERAASLRRAIEEGAGIESEIGRLSSMASAGRLAIEQAVGRLHRAEAEADAARRRISDAETRLEERHQLRRAARDLQAAGEFLRGEFRDAMLELEHRLLARAKVEFDHNFSRYFTALIEDPSLAARTDPQFNPSVDIEGEPTPPEALSGGERTALALAYRLALGDVVRSLDRLNLSTLILDEPTDGFSPEQVQRVGELLSELELPQVLLVSHEVALTGIADRVVRVRKVAGASELSEEGAASPAPPPVALLE